MTLKVPSFMISFLMSMSYEINLILNVGYEMMNDKAHLWTLAARGDAQWCYTWRRKHLYSCIGKETIFSSTWKLLSPKGANYSTSFAAKECDRMQNTEAEHRIIKSGNTEYLNWRELRQSYRAPQREARHVTLINSWTNGWPF